VPMKCFPGNRGFVMTLMILPQSASECRDFFSVSADPTSA